MSRLTMISLAIGGEVLKINIRPSDQWWYDKLREQMQRQTRTLCDVVSDALRKTLVSVSDEALVDKLKETAEKSACSLSAAVRSVLKRYVSQELPIRPLPHKPYIIWSCDPQRLDHEDPWTRRYWIAEVLVHGRHEDIRELDWEEVRRVLPELRLPPRVRKLWELYFARSQPREGADSAPDRGA